MIAECLTSSIFVSSRTLNRVAREAGFKVVSKSRWLQLQVKPRILDHPHSGVRLWQLAAAFGIELEALESLLLLEIERGKVVVAVRCSDCVLVHPSAAALAARRIAARRRK